MPSTAIEAARHPLLELNVGSVYGAVHVHRGIADRRRTAAARVALPQQ